MVGYYYPERERERERETVSSERKDGCRDMEEGERESVGGMFATVYLNSRAVSLTHVSR